MGLDRFGYPATHMANDILVNLDDYGSDTKQLENAWFDWLNFNPFDVEIGVRLSELYDERISTLDQDLDADRLQRLEKKLVLTSKRAQRYGQLLGSETAEANR